MQQFNYDGFLSYKGKDYEDFDQHYSFDEDDYDEDDKAKAAAASQSFFGISWDNLDSETIAQSIISLINRAYTYRQKSKPQRKSDDGIAERNAIEGTLRTINVAIFFKVAAGDRKQFFYQSDRVTQTIAEE